MKQDYMGLRGIEVNRNSLIQFLSGKWWIIVQFGEFEYNLSQDGFWSIGIPSRLKAINSDTARAVSSARQNA